MALHLLCEELPGLFFPTVLAVASHALTMLQRRCRGPCTAAPCPASGAAPAPPPSTMLQCARDVTLRNCCHQQQLSVTAIQRHVLPEHVQAAPRLPAGCFWASGGVAQFLRQLMQFYSLIRGSLQLCMQFLVSPWQPARSASQLHK